MEAPIEIEVSARHIHFSRKDLDELFGVGYELKKLKDLSQTGQYAGEETVEVQSDAGIVIKNVRTMGPVRDATIVELSVTDLYGLKMSAPTMVESFDEKNMAAPITIRGPKGEIKRSAAIVKNRHIHCDPESAAKYGLKDRMKVALRTEGDRSVLFQNVVVRIDPTFTFRCHLDTDEANAAGIKHGEQGWVVYSEGAK